MSGRRGNFGDELSSIAADAREEQHKARKTAEAELHAKVSAEVNSRYKQYLAACKKKAREDARAGHGECIIMTYFDDTCDFLYRVHDQMASQAVTELCQGGARAEYASDVDRPCGSDPMYDHTRYGIGLKIKF